MPEMEVVVESPKIHIAFIHQVVCSCFSRQHVKAVPVIDLPLGHPDECGNGASQVQQRMHLHRTAVLLIFSPWAKFQAEFNGTAVKGIVLQGNAVKAH